MCHYVRKIWHKNKNLENESQENWLYQKLEINRLLVELKMN